MLRAVGHWAGWYIFTVKPCLWSPYVIGQTIIFFTRYNALHCEFMNTPHVEFLNVPVCSAPMSFLAGNGVVRSALVLAARMRCLRRTHSNGRVCRVHTCVMAIGADFKMYLLRQFCSNRVYFYNTQETQTQNNGGPEF